MKEITIHAKETTKQKARSWQLLDDIVQPLADWKLVNSVLRSDEETQSIKFDGVPLNVQCISNSFSLEKNRLYVFQLDTKVRRSAPFALVLLAAELEDFDFHNCNAYRAMECAGESRIGFSYVPNDDSSYKLMLVNYYGAYSEGAELASPKVSVFTAGTVRNLNEIQDDTYLPNWGPIRRAIHRTCKSSRIFNSFIASLEMRLGREECLSLPMYMAICPTGQCNALCEFCSVTIKRTGIIKRQLPFDKLQNFLEPTLKTLEMCGLEGNGEPTLYHEFNSLLADISRHGTKSYLITNGTQIKPEQISHLLSLESITFSLNAASAETHIRVMKLNNFNQVTDNIKNLVAQRGTHENPAIFVSFVVYNANIHELQQFLQFAEYDLKVNVIMIRPLSELGNDEGAIEDLREIVPFESQVRDALDAAQEYLNDIPRRKIPFSNFYCDIRIDPATFRSSRPDPLDRVIMPHGFENRLLAPRRNDWISEYPEFKTSWHLTTVQLECSPEVPSGTVWRSAMTPVMTDTTLQFIASIKVNAGSPRIAIVSSQGEEIASSVLSASDSAQNIELNFSTGSHQWLGIIIQHDGNGFQGEIDFFRLLTPGPGIREEFKLPIPRRWQIDTPGVSARWRGSELELLAPEGLAGRYLFKSYSSPCSSNTKISLPILVQVFTGNLVIGVLNENFQSWIEQFKFSPGRHETELHINTTSNNRIQLVLFARGSESLNTRIDWRETLDTPPDRENGDKEEVIEMAVPAGDDQAPPEKATHTYTSKPRFSRKPKKRQPRIYCQKPWTDLNNFTVDGRMDVCCIATGPSQERYALGNIHEQKLQEVWNGERIREFRRTVNRPENKLPPCERCPMAYGYQGLFFDRRHTESTVNSYLADFSSKQAWVAKYFAKTAKTSMKWLLAIYFRGFRKQ